MGQHSFCFCQNIFLPHFLSHRILETEGSHRKGFALDPLMPRIARMNSNDLIEQG